jgi:hypothetical protein
MLSALASLGSSALGFLGTKYASDSSRDAAATAWSNSKQAASFQHARNKQLQQRQFRFNKTAYVNRYKWMTQDLKRAGLNPILAASGGFSPGSSPSVGLPSAGMAQSPMPQTFDPKLDISSALSNFAQADKSTAEAETTRSKQELLKKQTLTEIDKAANLRASTGKLKQEEKKLVQDTYLSMQQHAKMAREILKLGSEHRKIDEETENVKAYRKQIEALAQSIKYNLSQLKQRSDVYKTPYGSGLMYLNETMKAIGNLLGGGGAPAAYNILK